MPRRAPVTAALVGLVLASLPATAALALATVSAPTVLRVLELGVRSTVPDLLVASCGALGTLLLAGLTLDVLVSAVQESVALSARVHRTPGPVADGPTAPRRRLVRRLVALVVGLALGSGALAANAAPRAPQAGWATLAPVVPGWAALPAAVPDAGWAQHVPEFRPATAPVVDLPVVTRAPAPDTVRAEVVVQRGDTLWSLARAHTGPQATDVAVAAAVEELYEANAHVIGDDPDLLLPGQVLHLP